MYVPWRRRVPRAYNTRGDEATTGVARLRYQVKFAVKRRQQTVGMMGTRLCHNSNQVWVEDKADVAGSGRDR